jgi:hypothetical protein
MDTDGVDVNQKCPTHQDLEKWHRLVAYLQEISKATGNTLGPSQILSISHEMLIIIISVYSVIVFIPDLEQGKSYILVYTGIVATLSYMLRTFQRCFVPQMIENEVRTNDTILTLNSYIVNAWCFRSTHFCKAFNPFLWINRTRRAKMRLICSHFINGK